MLDLWTFGHSGLQDLQKDTSLPTCEKMTWMNNSNFGMTTLTPVEEDSLLSPGELDAQREWDLEFQRRKDDLARQQLKSRERRRAVSDKMAELRDRWQGVERRRQLRSRESGRGDHSISSLGVPNNHHSGSDTTLDAPASNLGNIFDSNSNMDASREASGDSSGLNR